MLTNLKKLSVVVAALALTACGGGGGGNTSTGGGVYYTHAELAQEFEDAMWYDLGYDVELVKINTRQYNYVVVRDYDLGTYDAYDLTNYNPGEDIGNFLDTNEWRFDYDLVVVERDFYGNPTLFENPITGTLYEKTEGSPKDRLKLAASEEHEAIKEAALRLSANFGLSTERAQEVGKRTYVYSKIPKESKTSADADRLAKDLLGHTFTEYMAAADKVAAGDKSELNQMISDAAELNGLHPEDANQIVENIFAGKIN